MRAGDSRRGRALGLSRAALIAAALAVSLALAGAGAAQEADDGAGAANEAIEITADTLEVRQSESVAIFEGAVNAVQGDLVLNADMLTVHYREAEGGAGNLGVSRIDAEGNVVVTSAGEIAQGQRGIYNVEDGIIDLVGGVVLNQGNNIVEGLVAEGVTSAANLQNFRFFTNHFETLTQGLDLVATWTPPRLGGRTTFGLLFNRTATTVAGFDPAVLDTTRIRQLQEALPGTRWNATVGQALGGWSLLGRASYYGEWFDARDLYLYHGDAVVDIEASYPVGASTTLTVGSRNVFGNDPEENPIARAKGNRFSAHTPFGYNGAFYYLRLNYTWASGG